MIYYDPMICIVPLKATSVRCPGKNFRSGNPLLCGGRFPLWEITARYIREEGWEPVVSCDSQEIVKEIASKGYRAIYWEPDPESYWMQGHISQVAGKVGAKNEDLILLAQATSPVRVPGMLKAMHLTMEENKSIDMAFTAERFKICGIMDNTLIGQDESQSATRWYDHYDGNLLLLRYDTLKRCPPRTVVHQGLKTVAVFYENPPYSLQIDTKSDYDLYRSLPPIGVLHPGIEYRVRQFNYL